MKAWLRHLLGWRQVWSGLIECKSSADLAVPLRELIPPDALDMIMAHGGMDDVRTTMHPLNPPYLYRFEVWSKR